MRGFSSELEKIAIKLRVIHGTNQAMESLIPRHLLNRGPVNLTDPNPSRVYLALKRKVKPKGYTVTSFAEQAAAAHGGTPTILHAKVDTKHGWGPISVNKWGTDRGYNVSDLKDIVEELDDPAIRGAKRADLWRTLNKATGTVGSPNFNASVKVQKSQPLRRFLMT
jgi:hypothetical protein